MVLSVYLSQASLTIHRGVIRPIQTTAESWRLRLKVQINLYSYFSTLKYLKLSTGNDILLVFQPENILLNLLLFKFVKYWKSKNAYK